LQYSIQKIFPTYLHCIHNIPISDEVLKYCLARPDLNIGNIRSNRGGKQSLSTNEDSIVKDLIQKIIDENIQTVCQDKLGIDNYWVNVNKRNNYNSYHSHPGAVLAGVVYVQASENSGDLEFFHPNMHSVFQETQLYGENNKVSQHTHISVQPKTGLCCIFPAYIMHGVEPNRTDDDRVSVSFNLIVRSS
tara:strand:- start:55 stop:624 length:570 start_codon:yes stop_codon:yes gene_type:complete